MLQVQLKVQRPALSRKSRVTGAVESAETSSKQISRVTGAVKGAETSSKQEKSCYRCS